jgi:phosphoribosylaminoimidazole-succinocarboxamide synthase
MALPNYEKTLEGSVKSIRFIELPSPTRPGVADFHVKNIYSVFDWGEMPMEDGAFLDNSSLLIESAFNFERMQAQGIPNSYQGLVMADGRLLSLKDAIEAAEIPVAIRMRVVNRMPGGVDELPFQEGEGYDYSAYQKPLVNNFMVPVEFIHREAGPLPDGSSFTRRLERGAVVLADHCLPADYQPGADFPIKVADWSTKYEAKDAYERPDVLMAKAGLTPEEFAAATEMVMLASSRYVSDAALANMLVGDGKLEVAIIGNQGSDRGYLFEITDFAGTFHEVRRSILPHGRLDHPVRHSKQTERNLHKKVDAEWARVVGEESDAAEADGRSDWKDRVIAAGYAPTALPGHYFEAKNTLSRAVVNHLIATHMDGASVYPDTPSLDEAALAFEAEYKRVA